MVLLSPANLLLSEDLLGATQRHVIGTCSETKQAIVEGVTTWRK
jgi:hypothetical protein